MKIINFSKISKIKKKTLFSKNTKIFNKQILRELIVPMFKISCNNCNPKNPI